MSNGSLLKAPEMHLVPAKGEWKPGKLGHHLAAQAAFQPYVSQPMVYDHSGQAGYKGT